VPVIGLLDGANGAERAACQAAGMDDCLVKPFTREQLTEAVRRWLPPQLIEPSDPTGKPSHSKLAA
jgi:CheY-like chemotaxis protein